MQQSWTLSSVTVHLKSGEQIAGPSAVMYVDAASVPVVVQVSKGDHRVSIAWSEVVKIEHG